MDFSWLTGIFTKLISIFSPLKTLQQWRIWAELQHWYERFRRWRDWYRDHVQTPMRQMQALQRQLFDQYFRPVLVLIDHIRQITGIVAIFNPVSQTVSTSTSCASSHTSSRPSIGPLNAQTRSQESSTL